jgi:hypothetical protein
MREIDPQSESRLTEALKRLGASTPHSAPPELGSSLLGEFRRHHARRRRVRRISIASLVVCLVLALSLMRVHRSSSNNSQKAALPATSTGAQEKQAATLPIPVVQTAPHVAPRQVSTKTKSSKDSRTSSATSRAFVALPGYDPSVPLDQLHVVRVQLPASALWQIGAPMTASAGTHNVTADFVVSQGGTPYAVRLVQ